MYFPTVDTQSPHPVSSSDQRYKGFHHYKMDPKFRVSVLSTWRLEAGEPFFLMVSKEDNVPVIKVLNQGAYEEKVNLVKASAKPQPEKNALLGRLAMLSHEATINDQGKLSVPKDMSEKAAIAADSDVVLIGRGNYFAICSKPNFETLFNNESDMPIEDDLGIF